MIILKHLEIRKCRIGKYIGKCDKQCDEFLQIPAVFFQSFSFLLLSHYTLIHHMVSGSLAVNC